MAEVNTTVPPEDMKFYVVEPMYVLFKLAILAFNAPDTKLCVGNGYIVLRNPGLAQSLLRWTCGEHRYDILSLHQPLIRGIQFLRVRDAKSLDTILNHVQVGLQNLSQCYDSDDGINTYLLKLLKIVHDVLLKRNSLTHSYFIQDRKDTYPSIINDEFIEDMWLGDEIRLMVSVLDVIKRSRDHINKVILDEFVNKHLEAMDTVLDNKSERFLTILKQKYNIVLPV